jgi:lipoprotein-releasing system permease protein
MYKYLLCWRYLRSRYIALASIISVMLGVATMIVVNGVMAGFSHEMEGRMHEVLSDISFQSRSSDGFPNAEWHMDQIRNVAGQHIAGMTPTVNTPAMLSFKLNGEFVNRPVHLIGVDEKTYHTVGDFGKYLQHPENRRRLTFELRKGGYDERDHQAGPDAPLRVQMRRAGWAHRRDMAALTPRLPQPVPDETNPFHTGRNPTVSDVAEGTTFDPAKEQNTGIVLGIALSSYRDPKGREGFFVLPGDDVNLIIPGAGIPGIDSNKMGQRATCTVVDFYESKMSEYDASFVFVPIRELQRMRGMTIVPKVNSIQIQLKEGVELNMVRDQLRRAFPPQRYTIETWRDKQGPLLAAVRMETAILNLLLFLIIAVAGFGILAIFYMIVVEKTRDIGILKSLGASSHGIMCIFLSYGLGLGIVGAGSGMALGLLFIYYINEIAGFLGWLTGRPLFDPTIYYFQQIPTIVDPLTVAWVAGGAALIAVVASIMPARRAARLHPVEALRYE